MCQHKDLVGQIPGYTPPSVIVPAQGDDEVDGDPWDDADHDYEPCPHPEVQLPDHHIPHVGMEEEHGGIAHAGDQVTQVEDQAEDGKCSPR